MHLHIYVYCIICLYKHIYYMLFTHSCLFTRVFLHICVYIYTHKAISHLKLKFINPSHEMNSYFIYLVHIKIFSQKSFLYLLTSVIYHPSPFYLLNKDKIHTLLKMLSIFPRIYFQIPCKFYVIVS